MDNTAIINASTIYTTVTPYLTSPNPPTRANFLNCSGAWGGIPTATHTDPGYVSGNTIQVDLSTPPPGTQCLEATASNYWGDYYTSLGSSCSTAVFSYSSSWVTPEQIVVYFMVGTPVGNVTTFNVAERNVATEANPGFNLSWGDVSGETNYQIVWRNPTLGKSGTIPPAANTTTTTLLEDSSEPVSTRNFVCDGSNYEFELEAYNADQLKRSAKVIRSCTRAYNDPGSGTGISITSAALSASVASAVPSSNRDSTYFTTVSIPVNINNPNPPKPVEATVRVTTTISYAGTTTLPPTTYDSVENYQISTTSSGTQNVNVDLVWPGVRETGESVSVVFKVEVLDSRQEGVISAVTTTPITHVGTFVPPSSSGPISDSLLTPPENKRSKTQIGIISGLNSMSEKREVFAGKEYDVKVTLSGTTAAAPAAPSGRNVIMLTLDITGSMASSMSTSTGTRRRFDIAKDALKRFVDSSRDSEYIGLSVFATCDAVWKVGSGANEFANPFWSFEGYNSQAGRKTGHALIINDFVSVASNKSYLKGQIDKLVMSSSSDIPTVCSKRTPLATNLGGGITASLAAFLGNSYTGATYTNSSNFSDGVTRSMRGRPAIPGLRPFVVLASDGEENMFPMSTQRDINGQPSPVDTAITNNIPIYTISMGAGSYAERLREIATLTRGRFAPGDSGDAIIAAFQTIREEIDDQSANSTITYKLNQGSFRYSNLAGMTITRRRPGESSETVLGRGCPSTLCSISSDTLTLNLPYFAPEDRIYLYLRATPILVNPLSLRERNIPVNDLISAVDFTTDNYLIENTYVDIIPQLPYFTVRGGNIYSKNSLVSILPEREEYFAKENEPIIFIGGGVTEFGMGESAPQKRVLNGYNVDTKFEGSFLNYYSKLTESLASETVNDDDILRPLSADLKIVRYVPPSINPSRVLNYNRSGILNRDMVVFCPAPDILNKTKEYITR